MLADCIEKLHLLNADRVFHHEDGALAIRETDPGGAGEIQFSGTGPYIAIRPGQEPIRWLKNTKCADGAFVRFDIDGAHVHIVELKSALNSKEWQKAKSQYEGMLLTILAVFGIFGSIKIKTITFYIAYKTESINSSSSANPILMKTTVGSNVSLGPIHDFIKEKVNVLNFSDAPLVKIVRAADGCAHCAI